MHRINPDFSGNCCYPLSHHGQTQIAIYSSKSIDISFSFYTVDWEEENWDDSVLVRSRSNVICLFMSESWAHKVLLSS